MQPYRALQQVTENSMDLRCDKVLGKPFGHISFCFCFDSANRSHDIDSACQPQIGQLSVFFIAWGSMAPWASGWVVLFRIPHSW